MLYKQICSGLNPYSNGILPDKIACMYDKQQLCLNPYSNGILPDNRRT